MNYPLQPNYPLSPVAGASFEPCCGYGYPTYVGGYGGYGGYGFRGGFALIVVLFILLIIIGASFHNKCC